MYLVLFLSFHLPFCSYSCVLLLCLWSWAASSMDCCLTGSLLLQIDWLIDWLICICSMQVNPVHSDGRPLGDTSFVRTGLLGFLGPVSWCLYFCHVYNNLFDSWFLLCSLLFVSNSCNREDWILLKHTGSYKLFMTDHTKWHSAMHPR